MMSLSPSLPEPAVQPLPHHRCDCQNWVVTHSQFSSDDDWNWYCSIPHPDKHHPRCDKFRRVVQRRLVAKWLWSRAA